jgi:hypothetical protein
LGDSTHRQCYINVPELHDEARRRNDPVLSIIAKRQYLDFRKFRLLPMLQTEVRHAIEAFCLDICKALQEDWLTAEERKAREEAAAEERAEAERKRREAEAKRRDEKAAQTGGQARSSSPSPRARKREAAAEPARHAGGRAWHPRGASFVPGAGKIQLFKDIDDGPEMVVVPAGSFMMGSPPI